jgi:hypothetical protein
VRVGGRAGRHQPLFLSALAACLDLARFASSICQMEQCVEIEACGDAWDLCEKSCKLRACISTAASRLGSGSATAVEPDNRKAILGRWLGEVDIVDLIMVKGARRDVIVSIVIKPIDPAVYGVLSELRQEHRLRHFM